VPSARIRSVANPWLRALLERVERDPALMTAIALSPVFKTPDEVEAGSPLFLDMVEDARVLYDPDGFLGRSFDRRRARLCQLGARRISRGNAWYWELKPDLKPGEVFAL